MGSTGQSSWLSIPHDSRPGVVGRLGHASRVPRIAHVEPITKARSLMGPFDYLAPPGTEIGQLLVVPFGRRDVTGVVVGMADESEIDEERLAAPRDVLPQSVPPDLVALARWMAR